MAVTVDVPLAAPIADTAGKAIVEAEAIVEARNIDKRYDTGKIEVHALRSVSFSVSRGEMVAIMGPSGSGKTTLLNCLSGLDAIDSGEVLIEGVALSAMSDQERTDYRARRMGFVFQFYNLMPVLSAVENVELPLLIARVPAKRARQMALAALDMVGLGERATHLPEELSGGQRQRATIARALGPPPSWKTTPLCAEVATTAAALSAPLLTLACMRPSRIRDFSVRASGAGSSRLRMCTPGTRNSSPTEASARASSAGDSSGASTSSKPISDHRREPSASTRSSG